MTIEMNTKYGNIDVSREVVAVIAGGAAVDCYGIVGMASQKHLKDGLTDLLGKENLARGVVIREENDEIHIDMYIIVSYGTKISEVAYNVQQKVKYQLEQMLGLKVNSANIFISGVRVTN
ncbi:Asp23/Gls24 family envelope stress response protein [Alkalicoccus halolimnae]|uniref:Asp23/Gls24 family envelope stress response protein n=1 Tax=Alkalicoccus halolimnae TaxID=1667239 RepID=A0A5C7F9I0_9BACI|nr:Asp23/Gls24 family envelope stress response protein [Alkalicoccus halolimnae]TXF87381.1 Asp23/Gls24 family envelope stress response protein [Alkalicoccus halolimnae]